MGPVLGQWVDWKIGRSGIRIISGPFGWSICMSVAWVVGGLLGWLIALLVCRSVGWQFALLNLLDD